MFWGSKKPQGRTVAVIDIDSGSVGCALVRLEPERQPKLFGQARSYLPVSASVHTAQLQQKILSAAREAFEHISTTAARIRTHQTANFLGEVDGIELFFGAPWSQFADSWQVEKPLYQELHAHSGHYFAGVPLHHHPFAMAAAPLAHTLFPQQETLFMLVGAEVTEVLLVHNGAVVGRATMPTGHNMLLRTLKTHGALTEGEAHSMLKLSPPHAQELFGAAGAHFVKEFSDIAEPLIAGRDTRAVLVLAQEPHAPWYAKVLGGESLQNLFPHGGVVRALRPHHVAPFVSSPQTDLRLVVEAVFVDSSAAAHARVVS